MSDTMHNLYGHARNDITMPGEQANTFDVEQTDAVVPADDAAENTGMDNDTADDDIADDTAVDADNDSAEDSADEVEARPAAGARGRTTVGDGVVAKVVNLVAREADGVHRLDDEDSSVAVDVDVATIRIAMVVEYGHSVKPLAERVRTDVIEAVEEFLGLDVAGVDVHVSDIHHAETV